MLLEDFKSCVPESLVVHLNEKRIFKLSEAAILAGKFILKHRTVFPSVRTINSSPVNKRASKKLRRVTVFKPSSDSKKPNKSIHYGKCCCPFK